MGNFYRFRNLYFKPVGFGGFQYVQKHGSKELIMQKISEQAFFIKKEEAIDLPDKVYETRNIELDNTQRKIYDEMKSQNIIDFKNHTSLAINELAKICKLREITGGFIISAEGIPVKISDTKINVLMEILEELSNDRQVIIWIQYHFEAQELKRVLGEQAEILYGLTPQKEKERIIKDFQEKKIRIIIAHPKSGGHGLNLQMCSFVIWYSISYSLEEYSQACDRVYRMGQYNKVTYIHLLAKDSIDEVIYKALQGKQNMAGACLSMLKGKV